MQGNQKRSQEHLGITKTMKVGTQASLQNSPELCMAYLPTYLSIYPSISHSSEANEDSLQPSQSVRKHSPRTSKVKQKHRFGAQGPGRVTKKEPKNT